MAKLDTFIKISVDGRAAIADLNQIEESVDGIDNSTEQVAENGMSKMQAGADVLNSKMAALAGPAAIGAVVTAMGAAIQKTVDLTVQWADEDGDAHSLAFKTVISDG